MERYQFQAVQLRLSFLLSVEAVLAGRQSMEQGQLSVVAAVAQAAS
jgi:hypothetical protein